MKPLRNRLALLVFSFAMIGNVYAYDTGDTIFTAFDGSSTVQYAVPANVADTLLLWDVPTQKYRNLDIDPTVFSISDYVLSFSGSIPESKIDGLATDLSNKADFSYVASSVSAINSNVAAKADTTIVGGSNNGLMPSYLFNRINAFPVFGTATQANWDATTTTDIHYIQNKPSIPNVQSTSVTTDASGNYTWTYPSSFSGSPNVTATVISGTSTSSFNVQVVSKSSTQAVFKVYSTTPTNILGSLLGAAPVATQATIDIIAIK